MIVRLTAREEVLRHLLCPRGELDFNRVSPIPSVLWRAFRWSAKQQSDYQAYINGQPVIIEDVALFRDYRALRALQEQGHETEVYYFKLTRWGVGTHYSLINKSWEDDSVSTESVGSLVMQVNAYAPPVIIQTLSMLYPRDTIFVEYALPSGSGDCCGQFHLRHGTRFNLHCSPNQAMDEDTRKYWIKFSEGLLQGI